LWKPYNSGSFLHVPPYQLRILLVSSHRSLRFPVCYRHSHTLLKKSFPFSNPSLSKCRFRLSAATFCFSLLSVLVFSTSSLFTAGITISLLPFNSNSSKSSPTTLNPYFTFLLRKIALGFLRVIRSLSLLREVEYSLCIFFIFVLDKACALMHLCLRVLAQLRIVQLSV